MPLEPLANDAIAGLLASGRGGKPKGEPTEPRTLEVWFKLRNTIREEGCENPDCNDPRVKIAKKKVRLVSIVKGKAMCRYCFLNGWLSDGNVGTNQAA